MGSTRNQYTSDLEAHPAWPWLSRVPGADRHLVEPLLARLDPIRAATPSAFWAFCGLATVPRPGGGRMAQPSRAHDETKKLCRQLGLSLLRANGAYARQCRVEQARLAATRSEWPDQRRHLTALRKTEKLFLAHLWLVWREALGLAVTRPHESAARSSPGPWDMVGTPRRRWFLSTPPVPLRTRHG